MAACGCWINKAAILRYAILPATAFGELRELRLSAKKSRIGDPVANVSNSAIAAGGQLMLQRPVCNLYRP